jgi:phosphoribosylformylglycinamidine cyclo-ligase
VYTGNRLLTETTDVEGQSLTVGKLLLSPTRTYLPVLRELLAGHREEVHGLIHCTGGGQTKVLKFLRGAHVVKDNLFDLPPLFRLIRDSSPTDWREMYQVFNMGHRMEIYAAESAAQAIIDLAARYGVAARRIGRVEASDRPRVTVESPHGTFTYEPDSV